MTPRLRRALERCNTYWDSDDYQRRVWYHNTPTYDLCAICGAAGWAIATPAHDVMWLCWKHCKQWLEVPTFATALRLQAALGRCYATPATDSD